MFSELGVIDGLDGIDKASSGMGITQGGHNSGQTGNHLEVGSISIGLHTTAAA